MTETLEERQLLAVGVLAGASTAVSNTVNIIDVSSSSASIESIKLAIAEAAMTTEDDVVKIDSSVLQFDSSDDEITIDYDASVYGSITIQAVNGDVTIDANSLARVFSIKNGNVILEGITLCNGVADYGGAIANDGELTLTGVSIIGNTATIAGGAIANSGALYIQDSFITNNSTAGDGAAVYDGDFSWPTVDLPSWNAIPDSVGSRGTTLTVDLSDYINAGSWSYSFSIADSTSAILASEPSLSSSGILSFTFIGEDDYYGEDDYSAINVTVTATDGINSDSATFSVSMLEQTSVTLAAILSNMTFDDAVDEYVQGSKRRPTGYSAEEIPSPSVVDVTADTTVQVWLQDFDWVDYADKVWDAGDFVIMGVQYRIHLENATVDKDALSAASDLLRSSYVFKQLDNGDYEFIVAYTSGANFGYEEALLLDVLPIKTVNSSEPVSATIYQINTDFTFPCYTRLYSSPTERDPARSHINVDPSQTLFVSTISNSSNPLSSLPGQAFDTNISRATLDESSIAFSNANVDVAKSLTISNSVIAGNSADGSGVVYISDDGTAIFRNVTIADNVSEDAAIYYAGNTSEAIAIANSIVINGQVAPVVGVATVSGSLFNESGWQGATEYGGGLLFTAAAEGDYSLVYGSEAMNIGDDGSALDVTGAPLLTDIAGAVRVVVSVDAGAYEYQGVAPVAPTNVRFATYSGGNTATLTWSASENATGYLVEALNASNEWQVVTETTSTSYDAIVVENAYYSYRVSAYTTVGNDTLYSATVSANIDTTVVPSGDLGLVASNYDALSGTAELSWTALSNASYYVVYEKVENGNWTMIEASVTDASYTVSGLEINTNYAFRIVATNVAGAGASGDVSLYTLVIPATPTDAAFGEFNPDSNEITITWSPVEHATGYTVEVYDSASTAWIAVERDNVTATSYDVVNVESNTTYTYRISAYNAAGSSAPTVVSFTNSVVPQSPTNVAVTFFKGAMSANLSWDLMDDAEGYNVYMKVDPEATSWIKLASLSSISHVYTVQNLAKNTDYVFGVSAWNSEGESESATVSLFTLFAPDAPTNVAFDNLDVGNRAATLTWSAVDWAEGYVVEQKIGDEWRTSATLGNDVTSWTVASLEESTTYVFRVSAFNDAGTSDAVEATLTTGSLSLPAAPTGLSIDSYSEETHRATITWLDNATNETGYEMQYSYDGFEWRSSTTLAADTTTRVASGLTPGVTYYFRLAAFNDVGYSEWAQIVYDVPVEVPGAPTNLSFSNFDSASQSLVVSWNDNSDDEIAFRVQYSLDQNEWHTSANTEANVTSYTASGLVAGRTYYYRVAAIGLYGVSEWVVGSYTVESTTLNPPAAPSDIIFTDAELTTNGVNVTTSWSDNSDNEDRFVIQFSYDNTNWYGAGSTDANVATRVATGLVSGRTYYFRVAAYNDAGYSDWTTATYVAPSADVNSPSDFVFGEYSNGQLPMSWSDNSNNELGFVVQFSYDGVNWHRAGSTEANVTSRIATSMTPGRLYYFRVAAYNADGYSEWATGQYTTPSGAPSAPGEITFANYSAVSRTVGMTWVDNSGEETGFNVQYSIDGGNTWLTSGNTSADVNYRTATGLRVGTTYQFRVRSFNAYGSSGWTTGSFVVPVSENAPAAPTDFVFGDYDADSKTLSMSWSDNATNESGFKVQYSVDGGDTWYSAGSYGANITSRTATSVSPGRTYTFRVAAYNSDGTSAWLISEAYVASASANIPTAPTNVGFGDYDRDARTVVMSWNDNSSNEKGFKVEYSVDGGTTWNASAYLATDVTSRTVTGLVAGRNYSFRVAAYNNYGYSDWAIGSYSVVTTETVVAPEDLGFAYSSKKRQILLNWVGDAASYNVQFRDNSDSEWYSLTASGTTATLNNVLYGAAYYFRVQAVASDGAFSEWTESSYDTKTGAPIASDVKIDPNAELFNEVFKDYFDDLL